MEQMDGTEALFEHVRSCDQQSLAECLRNLSQSSGTTIGQLLATVRDRIGRNALQVAAYHGHLGK